MRKLAKLLGALAAATMVSAGSANALTIDSRSNQIISQGFGDIFVVLEGFDLEHERQVVASSFGQRVVFNNLQNMVGDRVTLGTLAAGEAIEFRLDNLIKGFQFFSGLGSNNRDGRIHAVLTQNADGSVRVGFEDRLGGQDGDFNDFFFTVYETPVPAAALLMLSGLAGFGFASRRKKS